MAEFRERFAETVHGLQAEFCAQLAADDGARDFGSDRWRRPGGGGGVTRALEQGEVFERAAINVSVVDGQFSEAMAARLGGGAREFYAAGLSSIIHPRSPMIPTAHFNVRYLERGADYWFGGGGDLTPYYLFADDAATFHADLQAACARHPGVADYPRFKTECDRYFWLSHRDEARGVGGIFFDELRCDRDHGLAFAVDLTRAFYAAYRAIVRRRRDEPWGEHERDWQLYRRGRYVEFNLVHDRGTRFGLETDGRSESILLSLPPLASWSYAREIDPASREGKLMTVLRCPRDWVS